MIRSKGMGCEQKYPLSLPCWQLPFHSTTNYDIELRCKWRSQQSLGENGPKFGLKKSAGENGPKFGLNIPAAVHVSSVAWEVQEKLHHKPFLPSSIYSSFPPLALPAYNHKTLCFFCCCILFVCYSK
jgi:hypothetical protein